jgi:plastocyanin
MRHTRIPFAITLAAVVVLVAVVTSGGKVAAGGAHCRTQAITDEAGIKVETRGFCYEPTVLRIEAGQTVEWTNRDAAPHTVSGVNGAWGDFTQFGEGESISFRFPSAGVFPYFCALHPGMIGSVVVDDRDVVNAATVAPSGPTASLLWLAPVILTTLAAGAFVGVVRRG